MATKENIIEINNLIDKINQSWKEQKVVLDQASESLQGYNENLESLLPSTLAKKLKENIELKRAQAKLDFEINKLEIQAQQVIQAKLNTDIKSNNEKKSKILLTRQEILETERQEKAESKAQATLERGLGIYNKVQAKVSGMTAEYYNLATAKQLGLTLTAKEEVRLALLTSRIEKYQNTIKKVQFDIGKYNLNVGNYSKSGFNPLSNSISQISRELPNFGQSFQIGVMSLTNNIGALQDALEAMRAKNAILKAEGKATESILSAVAGNVFSLNTALFIGIGIFAAYGKEIGEWAETLFDGAKALYTITELQLEFNKSLREANISYQKEVDVYKQYRDIAAGKNYEDKKIAIDKLRETYAYWLKDLSDEQIANLKGSEIEKKILAAKRANSNYDLTNKNIDIVQGRIKLYKEDIIAQEKYAAETLRLRKIINEGTTYRTSGIEKERVPVFSNEAKQASNEMAELNKRETERIALLEKEGLRKGTLAQKNARLKTDEASFLEYQKQANKFKAEAIGLEYKEKKDEASRLKDSEKARKDYYRSDYEIIKLQLENAIKYNTAIMNDENQTFGQRKRASIQLSHDRMQLVELEYQEQKRVNEFKMEDDLRVEKVRRDNVLKNSKSTAAQRADAEVVYAEKVFGITKEYENKGLLSFIKYHDAKKEVAEETFRHQEELLKKLDRYNFSTENNAISQEEINGLKILQKLMMETSTKTTLAEFQQIEGLKVAIAKNSTKSQLEAQIALNKAEMDRFEQYSKDRLDAEKELARLLDQQQQEQSAPKPENKSEIPTLLSYSTGDQIEEVKTQLATKLRYFDLESQAYADLQKTKLDLEKNYNNLTEKEVAEILQIKLDAVRQEYGVRMSYYDKLNRGQQKTFDNLIRQLEEAKTEAEKIRLKNLISDFKTLTTAADQFTETFVSSVFSNSQLSSLFDVLNGKLSDFKDDAVAQTLLITEAFQEMYNFISLAGAENFDAERSLLEERRRISIAFAGDSETAKAEIERQAEAKRKEIAKREFNAKKQMTLTNIAMDTAQAIVASVAKSPLTFGLPFSAVALAIGLAQAAIVNSQQIPEFWEGGVHEKDGWLKMNDDPKGVKGSNYREVAVTPKGQVYKPSGRNVYANMPKGTKIFPTLKSFDEEIFNRQLENVLSSSGISSSEPLSPSGDNGEILNKLDQVVTAITEKTEWNPVFDKHGFNMKVRNGHSEKEILNNDVNFTPTKR